MRIAIRGIVDNAEVVSTGERKPGLGDDIAVHIFTVSSALVGVCLTVIGLIRVVVTVRKVDTIADDLLALDAVLFLISGLIAYWTLRRRHVGRMHKLERTADVIFVVAMILMVGICGFITYAISIS